MEIKILEENSKALKANIKGIDVGLANALRRYIINSIKCFAIDSVTFYENNSSMFDEYIAHRIGLLPLKTPKGYHDSDEIRCSMEAEGPNVVYSKSLKSSDPDVSVASENIPLIKLGKGQRIRLEGKAVIGNAQKHAKFQAGLATYEIDGDVFKFYIESFGQMPPKDMLKRACDELSSDLKDVAKVVKKL